MKKFLLSVAATAALLFGTSVAQAHDPRLPPRHSHPHYGVPFSAGYGAGYGVGVGQVGYGPGLTVRYGANPGYSRYGAPPQHGRSCGCGCGGGGHHHQHQQHHRHHPGHHSRYYRGW